MHMSANTGIWLKGSTASRHDRHITETIQLTRSRSPGRVLRKALQDGSFFCRNEKAFGDREAVIEMGAGGCARSSCCLQMISLRGLEVLSKSFSDSILLLAILNDISIYTRS
jgi:hypothetical protein